MKKQELTKFEKARIVGARALQLSLGAPCLLKKIGTSRTIELATRELEEGILPLQVIKHAV